MRSRLSLVACLAALSCAAPVPAQAVPSLRTLTVRGEGNTYADVVFVSRVRLSTSSVSTTPPRYATRGSYAGVFVAPLGRPGPGAGTVLLRGMPGLEDVPFPLASPHDWLAPGRYRVHLLGDAPATIRVHAEGLRGDMRVVTTRRSAVVGGYVDRGVAGVQAPASRLIVPFTVRPGTLTVISSVQRSTGFYGRREVCVRERSDGLSPCLEGNAGRGWYWSVIPFEWTVGGAAVYSPGELATGPAEVEFVDISVGAIDKFYTFVLTLG